MVLRDMDHRDRDSDRGDLLPGVKNRDPEIH